MPTRRLRRFERQVVKVGTHHQLLILLIKTTNQNPNLSTSETPLTPSNPSNNRQSLINLIPNLKKRPGRDFPLLSRGGGSSSH